MNHVSTSVGLALAGLVLVGCTSPSGSTEADSEPPSSASASPDSETSVVESTQEPSPTVTPATGEAIKVKGARIALPADWQVGSASALQATGYPEAGTYVTLFRFTQLEESLDELARNLATRTTWDRKLTRREDITVDDQVVTHLSGRVLPGQYVEMFGTLRGGESLELEFLFGNKESRAVRDQIVQSVIATWEFTG